MVGEHKRTIPVYLGAGANTLVESFFMCAPDENAEEVYAALVRRNQRTYTLRLTLPDDAEVMPIAVLPLPRRPTTSTN